ncbi:hypothetical protein Csa_010467 [Cucumis sativus]|uniref:Uncharacterized protein n=1 Tax=Cucumis sativus TaxID=3659 RepID=A0A0A0LAP7_CUCSA|nr:hypothetical protein Csa_010467 [Cucumis sativus]
MQPPASPPPSQLRHAQLFASTSPSRNLHISSGVSALQRLLLCQSSLASPSPSQIRFVRTQDPSVLSKPETVRPVRSVCLRS